jgi:hypothetical protein
MARLLQWIVKEDEEGKDRVLLMHYNDPGVCTRVYEADELVKVQAWDIASKLNAAYEHGRTSAMEELRALIGIK